MRIETGIQSSNGGRIWSSMQLPGSQKCLVSPKLSFILHLLDKLVYLHMSSAPTTELATCPTLVLPDTPTQEDSFSHSRVSTAIADVILSTQGGKSIGLVGTWGSGKSTVIELLRRELTTRSKHAEIFIFDAWAHQGDPLRRTFLEQLINRLCELRWLDYPEVWSERKDELARRVQKITTKTRPVLTFLGAWFAILLLLLPVGLQLFSKYDPSNFNHPRLAAAGLILALLPFAFALSSYIYLRPTWKFWRSQFWSQNRGKYSGDNLLALFLNRTQEHTDSTTTRTPDPTSLEFQELFTDLLSNALDKQERRLIIVIDNLDRIEAREALEIWATMKAFFDVGRHNTAWIPRMWLIVPFDPKALRKLWPDPKNTEAAKPPCSDALADSFIDKTFQLTFRVSPPLLSDWRQFFEDQLRAAFPVGHESDIHTVYRLYDLKRLGASRPPTPRDIKLFINAVGTIHRQWQHDIPLPLQSLYVLLAKQYPQLEDELASKSDKELLAPVPPELAGSNWRQNISAIHFNVPINKALETALGGTVKVALIEDDVNELQRLHAINGFENVLERVVESEYAGWANENPVKLARAANSLAKVAPDLSSLEESWRWLRYGAIMTKSWGTLNSTLAAGLIQLIRRYKDVGELITSLCKSLPASFVYKDEILGANDLLASMHPFVNILRTMRDVQPESISANFVVPGSEEHYLKIIAALAASGAAADDVVKLMRPSVTPEDVVQELASYIPGGQFQQTQFEIFQLLRRIDDAWPWELLVTACDTRLRTAQSLPAEEIRNLSEVLMYLSVNNANAENCINSLTESGFFANHLWYASQASDKQAQAVITLMMLDTQHSFGLSSAPWQANNGMTIYRNIIQRPDNDPEILTGIAETTYKLRRFAKLYEIGRTFPEALVCVKRVLSMIADIPEALAAIPANDVIEEYPLFADSLSDHMDELVRVSVERARLAHAITLCEFQPSLGSLYLKVLSIADDEEYMTFIVSELRVLTRGTWDSELATQGPLMQLALAVQEKLPPHSQLDLGPAFGDALQARAEQLLSGTVTAGHQEKLSGGEIVGLLAAPSKTGFLFRLAEMICDSKVSTAPLLELYGHALRDSAELLKHIDRLGFSAMPKMLDRKAPEELGWLLEVIKRDEVRGKLPNDACSEMIDRIDSLQLDSLDENIRRLVEELRDELQRR